MATATGRASVPARTKKPRHSTAQKKAARRAREERDRGTRRPERRPDPARPQHHGAGPSEPSDRPRREDRRGSDDRPRREDRRTGGGRPRDEGDDRSRWEDRRTGADRPRREDRPVRVGPGARVDRPRQKERPLPAPRSQGHPEARHERLQHHHDRVQEHRRRAGPAHPTAPRGAALAELLADGPFTRLGLAEPVVRTLASHGITEPFPIQAATIPDALAGRDVLGRGQTGSGKTLAFGLPTVQRLHGLPRAAPQRPTALVLTPTRELAMQVVDALRPVLDSVKVRYQLVAGGLSYTPQRAALERGVELLVATPGRLIDLMDQGVVDLSAIRVTVLDEADHMSQMGFLEEITRILDDTPRDAQRLLFSATLDHGVDDLVARYLTDPVTHQTDAATASVATMEHHVFLVHPHHKKPVIAAMANRPGRTLAFVRTKLGADRVAAQLREQGVFAAALHGGLNQGARNRVLSAFRDGDLPVLVATDVAARGIHVDDVSLVVQIDPPADHKDYLHRSGRTARAGDRGVVVTLALPHQKRTMQRLFAAAGVETEPVTVTADGEAVGRTTGGHPATGEAISDARLDALLAPPRRSGRPGGRRPGSGDRGGRPGPRRAPR